MRLLRLCLKNILHNKTRAFTLGTFVLAIAFMIVMAGAFSTTVRTSMQEMIVASVTGHVQLRPAANPEKDMFAFDNNWETTSKYAISGETLGKVEAAAAKLYPGAQLVPRVRANVMLVSDTEKVGAMLLGTDPSDRHVDLSFRLVSGRMLQPGDDHVIVLPRLTAEKLEVKVGDTVGAMGVTPDGYPIDAGLTVVGIGDNGMSWKYDFGFRIPYLDLVAARELAGLNEGEATDAVLFLPDTSQAAAAAKALDADLNAGLPEGQRLRTTTFATMGGFMMTPLSLYNAIFTFFIAIIAIIAAIITMNIILMMGIERRQEIGTMRAIGYSRGRIVGLFVAEILIISASFGLLGAGGALVLVKWLSSFTMNVARPVSYATGSEFRMLFSLGFAVPTAIIVPAFAVLASLYPSLRASRERPAATLHEE